MRKQKWLSVMAGSLIIFAILVNTGLQPHSWGNEIYILGALVGLIPSAIDILRSARRKKVHPGIPVAITILVLLYIRRFLIADIFTLLIIAGNLFKEYILWQVERSVKEISSALPDIAILKSDDQFKEIHIRQIRKGDILIVKAGSRVPVDGILLGDDVTLDESVITGESRMVSKNRGAHLIAGSINQGSAFEMHVTDSPENSTLAQIHKMVDEAQKHDTRLSRFTDRIVIINGLVALAGALLLYLLTKDIMRSLAFWIALVPVVFAIIVPVATTIGISLLARHGIMVKSGEALENLTKINSIVFDKTGTLTIGRPEIKNVIIFDNQFDELSLLRLAAGIENYSEHPLSKAFVHRANKLQLAIPDAAKVTTIKGRGVTGICEGRKVIIGNLQMMKDNNLIVPSASEGDIRNEEESGSTAIFVAMDSKLVGVFFLSDLLREHIAETMSSLSDMGKKLTMITGDNQGIAKKVAAELGLTRFYAGTLPQDKIKYIREFKANGERVIMVGDGINDAPAISESNVGIAMGLKGIDITLNSAKVVLVNDDINSLPFLLTLSGKVLSIIRLDLYLATAIHLVAAILSLLGVVTVLGSAVIHQVSSVLVLLNTMRLYSIRK